MHRSTLLMVTAVATLPACATVTDMRSAAPRAVYTTAKPIPAIEACLIGGAFNWLSAPRVIRAGGSTEVVFGTLGNAGLHIRLSPDQLGTSVEVRQQVAYGPRSRRIIEACLE